MAFGNGHVGKKDRQGRSEFSQSAVPVRAIVTSNGVPILIIKPLPNKQFFQEYPVGHRGKNNLSLGTWFGTPNVIGFPPIKKPHGEPPFKGAQRPIFKGMEFPRWGVLNTLYPVQKEPRAKTGRRWGNWGFSPRFRPFWGRVLQDGPFWEGAKRVLKPRISSLGALGREPLF